MQCYAALPSLPSKQQAQESISEFKAKSPCDQMKEIMVAMDDIKSGEFVGTAFSVLAVGIAEKIRLLLATTARTAGADNVRKLSRAALGFEKVAQFGKIAAIKGTATGLTIWLAYEVLQRKYKANCEIPPSADTSLVPLTNSDM